MGIRGKKYTCIIYMCVRKDLSIWSFEIVFIGDVFNLNSFKYRASLPTTIRLFKTSLGYVVTFFDGFSVSPSHNKRFVPANTGTVDRKTSVTDTSYKSQEGNL